MTSLFSKSRTLRKTALRSDYPRTSSTRRGQPSAAIVENEWRVFQGNWDVQAEGKVITVRDAPRQISLRLIQEPPTTVIVDRVDMHIRGFHFKGNESTLAVELPGGGHRSLENCLFDGCAAGIVLG